MDIPLVSFVIVNYNGRKFLKECLDSIFNLDYSQDKLEVIVVDNGSKDGSISFIDKNYPKVKLIKNSINNYCLANNLAIKTAKAEYVALVNNDVELEKNWLKALLRVILKDRRIGAVTGKVFLYNKRINSTGHIQKSNFYWQDRGFNKKDEELYGKIEEVEGISHCACLYRKTCFYEVGFLDEELNMYLEDVDMSIRLKRKGWKLYYNPEAICYHRLHGSASSKKRHYFYERNRLLIVAKHYPECFREAIFDNGLFPTIERLNKKFLFSILEEIEQKFNGRIFVGLFKREIEEFHYRYKKRIFFVRMLYNLLWFTSIRLSFSPFRKIYKFIYSFLSF